LNQQSTRVAPSTVRQGVLSVLVPGFTVDFAEPLREELGSAGWPVRPTTIIDSFLDVAGVRRVEVVDPDEVPQLQKRCVSAWRRTVAYLAGAGVHGLSCWPAERMLRALVIAADTWPEAHLDARLSSWVVCALWDGHQANGDMLVQDLASVQSGRKAGSSWDEVIDELSARLDSTARLVKAAELSDFRSSPSGAGRNGGRERLLYGITFPKPPVLTKTAKVPVWIPLTEIPAGLSDWALVLGTVRSVRPSAESLSDEDRKGQLVTLPNSSSVRSKALAAAMNEAMVRVGSKVRPKR
jgi:hypothetical protein